MTNSKELFQEVLQKITFTSDRNEAEAVVRYLLEHRYELSQQELLLGKPITVDVTQLNNDITRINQHEPVQYILETAWFFNRKFIVRPGVLIPRPETEIVVEAIIKEASENATILDVGTGSGCIAISLALETSARVFALDISEEALNIARENAEALKASVSFSELDILKEPLPFSEIDLLISNPPYIREQEKKSMEQNVLGFEPSLALFVPDDDPLLFYRALAEQGKKILKSGGKILAEINSALGNETVDLMNEQGYHSVHLIKDMEGKNRIIKATR